MAKTPTANRGTFAARIAIVQQHLEGARQQHEAESLALHNSPDDQDQQRLVDDLEAEVAGYLKTISRLQAAEVASAKQDTGEERAAARELRTGRLAQLKRLDRKIEDRTQQLVKGIESLAPGLLDLGVAMTERSQLSWALLRAEIGSDEALRRYGSGLSSADVRGEVATALVNAIVGSGLGTVGVDLAPSVIVTEPGIAFDARNFSLTAQLAKRNAKRDGLIDAAIQAGGNHD
jgi:hypothetical protein